MGASSCHQVGRWGGVGERVVGHLVVVGDGQERGLVVRLRSGDYSNVDHAREDHGCRVRLAGRVHREEEAVVEDHFRVRSGVVSHCPMTDCHLNGQPIRRWVLRRRYHRVVLEAILGVRPCCCVYLVRGSR